MPSRVYFIAADASDNREVIKSKLTRLLETSRLLDCICKNDTAAIKIHFGEKENTGYVRPEYVRVIHDAIVSKGATTFLSDTNTLYRGKRTNSADHLKLAYEHGFTADIVGAPVVIADDTKKENVAEVAINRKFIQSAKVARFFLESEALVGIAHFKGHLMTGFGGALKNIGMGCATREGKLTQHCDVSPFVIAKKCVGCEDCQKVCPVGAIEMKNKKAYLDRSKCIGCASCIAACNYHAIDVDWELGADTIQEKMVEYAYAVLKGKRDHCIFFNFAMKITKECDCLAKDDPRIVPDVGIFASFDPVSIDRATLDLVNQAARRDIFRKVHPQRDANKQLRYACELGLGNLDYELIELTM